MNKAGLISFEQGWRPRRLLGSLGGSYAGVWRPAVLIVLLAAATAGLAWGVSSRQPVYATMSGLSSLERQSDGSLEGTFVVWLYNNTVRVQSVRLSADGLPPDTVDFGDNQFHLPAGDVNKVTLRFAVPAESVVPGPHRVQLYVQDATTQRLLARTSAPIVFPPSLVGALRGMGSGAVSP